MNHWSNIVKALLQSKTGDLKELAKIAGSGDRNFYSYESLEECDLRGQDLSGLNLTGCNINKSIYDNETIIDEEFEFRENKNPGHYSIKIPKDLANAVSAFSDYYQYVYKAWAYKNLYNRFKRVSNSKKLPDIIDIVNGNTRLIQLCEKNFSGETQEVIVLLNKGQLSAIEEFEINNPNFDADSFGLLAGLISARIPYSKLGFLNDLPMESLWGLSDQ